MGPGAKMGTMKPQTSSSRRTGLPTIAAIATLVSVGLLALIFAAPAVRVSALTRDRITASPCVESSGPAGRSRGLWYLRLEQWRADARTLVAAVRYVVESDVQTNQEKPAEHFPGIAAATPTNATPAGPKA
jgi:hypothetical protein